MFELHGKHNTCKVFTDNCDNETISQITELLNQESVKDSQIRIMPDTHAGKGCVIGTTMTLIDKVIPNLVGVDIGCGMYAIKLRETEIDCEKLDKVIRQYVPSGFSIHDHAIAKSNAGDILAPVNVDRAMKSLGTLGGGNHFIEVDRGNDGHLWLVIHTGSRHLGIEVCDHYQDLAWKKIKNNGIDAKVKATVEKLKAEGKHKDIENTIKILRMQAGPVPKDLCYVEGDDFKDYIHDMKLAQEHAAINRETIASQIIKHMGWTIDSSFQTIHNYIDTEKMILRKGAVSAQKDETLIIPMNMRDGSLICVGKGNPDWNYSAPHGAGRIMSRGQAKERVSMDEFKESMKDVWTTSVTQSTIDESPMVYKPMQEIIDNIQDTVDIVDIIKPIYNFKSSDV
jgi:tRNA-splicing ligase RtcB